MLAAREGHTSVVKYLIDAGINVKLRDKNGDTALDIANDNDNPDIVMLLKRAGVKVQAKKKPPVAVIDDEDDDDLADVESMIDEEGDVPPDDVDLDD
jgi:ankyrin repeat protein